MRYALTDAERCVIEPILPCKPRGVPRVEAGQTSRRAATGEIQSASARTSIGIETWSNGSSTVSNATAASPRGTRSGRQTSSPSSSSRPWLGRSAGIGLGGAPNERDFARIFHAVVGQRASQPFAIYRLLARQPEQRGLDLAFLAINLLIEPAQRLIAVNAQLLGQHRFSRSPRDKNRRAQQFGLIARTGLGDGPQRGRGESDRHQPDAHQNPAPYPTSDQCHPIDLQSIYSSDILNQTLYYKILLRNDYHIYSIDTQV